MALEEALDWESRQRIGPEWAARYHSGLVTREVEAWYGQIGAFLQESQRQEKQARRWKQAGIATFALLFVVSAVASLIAVRRDQETEQAQNFNLAKVYEQKALDAIENGRPR